MRTRITEFNNTINVYILTYLHKLINNNEFNDLYNLIFIDMYTYIT